MTAPIPAETQAACAKLHGHYCALTGRPEPLRFHAWAWFELLRSPEYAYAAERLWKDVQHLVRYLQMGIRDEKRNAGCLKLRNFLQPDTFLADLAEARATLRERKERAPRSHRPAPGEAPAPVEATQQVADGLRKFKEGLR